MFWMRILRSSGRGGDGLGVGILVGIERAMGKLQPSSALMTTLLSPIPWLFKPEMKCREEDSPCVSHPYSEPLHASV